MSDLNLSSILSKDQESILSVYYLYTSKHKYTYLQYTAACALMYFLTQKNIFNYDLDETLVYDYKEERRYIWESKDFMEDINILRDKDYLIRARSRSKTYRDVNAHQCSSKGINYIDKKIKESKDFKTKFEEIEKVLSCSKGHLFEVHLKDNGPKLVCEQNAKECIRFEEIKGFLKDLSFNNISLHARDLSISKYKPFFLSKT